MAEEAKKEKRVTEKFRENPWMISTTVLAIIVIVMIIYSFFGSSTMSKSEIQAKALTFINSQLLQGQQTATISSVAEKSGLYVVSVTLANQTVPLYFTKDGNWINNGYPLISISNSTSSSSKTVTPSTTVPKTDKPVVEAFVFAYCPYGLQFEKALFSVYDLLKTNADIKIVYIGAMHGEFEHTESLRQISIENIYGRDKLFAYLKLFDTSSDIGACSGDDTCLNKYLPAIYSQLGFNQATINNYMTTSAEAIYQQDEAAASALGISGSPTFVINGVESQVSRTPQAIETAVCSAFNTAPAACSQVLSSASTSAGFGASSGTSSSASCG